MTCKTGGVCNDGVLGVGAIHWGVGGVGGWGWGGVSEPIQRHAGCYGGVAVFAVWFGLGELVWEVRAEFHVEEEVVGRKELL